MRLTLRYNTKHPTWALHLPPKLAVYVRGRRRGVIVMARREKGKNRLGQKPDLPRQQEGPGRCAHLSQNSGVGGGRVREDGAWGEAR